jgi:small subunit ribosomal protein S1|tara:strand:- start:184 stop:1905 length:1722 start_codon:yes stop_codon:yes gene_type:complete
MAVETQLKNQSSSLKEFENLLNEDFKDRKLKENQLVQATVTEITKNFVILDLRAKMEAMIPCEEFKETNELEKLKVGSTVEVYLERIESYKGEIIVSYSKAKRMKAWKKLERVFESGEEVIGTITGRVKGGYVTNVEGLPCFMPSSQIDIRPLKKIDHLMGIPLKVVAVRLDKVRGNCAVSRRQVLEKNKDSETKELLKNIKEGDIVEAEVKACVDFGVFLSYKNLDMLLHITDLSHGRVAKPSDLVTIGQKLKVKITKIDQATNRVSASIKALTEDPYSNIEQNFKVGEIYKGTVQKIMQYGAFVKLADGIEGLVHSSFMSWTSKNVDPNKMLSPSQEIEVKIISIEPEIKRISLSYRDTLENPWKEINVGDIFEVKVKSITDKAIFCDLDSGLTGMIHYRELSFNENEDDLKKYKKNDLIKVRIIDLKNEKIRFSVRALEKDPMDWFKENKKSVGDVITTRIYEVMKTGVKVSIDNDKKIVVTIKKSQLAKEAGDSRTDIFSKGNALDAKILELDIPSRIITLSPKQAQIDEEKSLVAKFGKGAAKSGATLKGIFEKAIGKSSAKKEKKDK